MGTRNDDDTRRARPEERFAGPQHQHDLLAVAARLREQVPSSGTGHQQETLYKRGRSTVAVFAFRAGGRLAEHRANGLVVIQGLGGRLRVTAGGESYDLRAGGLVVLTPNVPHEVAAPDDEPGQMLLTVHLEV